MDVIWTMYTGADMLIFRPVLPATRWENVQVRLTKNGCVLYAETSMREVHAPGCSVSVGHDEIRVYTHRAVTP